jgi:cytoskeleton protein RodZ
MSELGLQSATLDQGHSVQASPGAMIRSARQAAGMHIEALAMALKVPVSKLEALEADNYQVLPDAVFVRALASSVCRSLKLDPGPVLALMPKSSVPELSVDGAGINTAFRDGTEKARGSAILAGVRHPVFLAVFALLVGAAALALFPRSVSEVPIAADEQAQKTVASPSELNNEVIPPANVASADTGNASLAMESGSVASSARPSVPDSNTLPVSPVVTAADAIDSKGQLLVLRARSESWVQVRDATGATTLQKILTSGESVVVPGKPPLSVVIGNAEVTEVLVQGKAMDLASIAKDNVARFEVQP